MWKFGYDINSTTKWIAFALTLLFASNVAFITAFVTTSWGQLTGLAADNSSAVEVHWWRCGLWQCCRDDGFCLGTRWPGELLKKQCLQRRMRTGAFTLTVDPLEEHGFGYATTFSAVVKSLQSCN